MPATSTTVVPFDPVFADPERLALAGFLAGYSEQTRDAYGLDLRQFLAFCHEHGLELLKVRRADIEIYARTLGARGRARATIARRLSTVAGGVPCRAARGPTQPPPPPP